MKQVMKIEKVNKFNILNEAVEAFTSTFSQSLVNARTAIHLKQKAFHNVYET